MYARPYTASYACILHNIIYKCVCLYLKRYETCLANGLLGYYTEEGILFLLCVMYKMKFNASLSNLGSLPAVTRARSNPSGISRVHNTMYLSFSVPN